MYLLSLQSSSSADGTQVQPGVSEGGEVLQTNVVVQPHHLLHRRACGGVIPSFLFDTWVQIGSMQEI